MSKRKLDSKTVRLALAENDLSLAKSYYLAAKKNLEEKISLRLAVDAGYNAAELAIKGLLALKIDFLPATHTGTVQKFSEIYIKSGVLEKDIGRGARKGLSLRNKARYEKTAKISKENCLLVLNLAKDLIKILEKEIKNFKS